MRQISLRRSEFSSVSLELAAKRSFLRGHAHLRAATVAAAACLALGVGAMAQTTYRDPGGNFSVDVPAGWRAEKDAQGSMVFVSKGSVIVSVDVVPTTDGSTPAPKDVLDGLEAGLKKQCATAQVVHRGNATLAGQAAVSVQLACTHAEHGAVTMFVEVATLHGQILLGNMSAPTSDYANAKPVADSILQSFRLGVDAGPAAGGGGQAAPADPPAGNDAQRARAVEEACASGVLTPDECAAKRAALKNSRNSEDGGNADPRLQALEKACKAGVFTPEECAAKRTQLQNGGSPSGPQNTPPASRGLGDPGGPRPVNPGGAPAGGDGGTVYNDPSGAFRLTVPTGWTAKTKSGCYGPAENCPPNSSGVNIYQGDDWAFVAPFSAPARTPTEVVNIVGQQYQGQYQNLKMVQNEPQKFNGLDIALGQFSGTDGNGTNVSLVVIGIAAPNGRFYVACSGIPVNDAPTAGPALSGMLQTLEFAGQQTGNL